MPRVLDLTADEEGEAILHRTDSGGLISSGSLAAEPLASYLADGETARYLLRNRKRGVTVEEGGEERTYAPDGDHGAVALVTDRRLLYVAGRADGDETVSLPLADVLEADADGSMLRADELVVETPHGRRVRFPCRGDMAAVVEVVRDDAAAWSHAERLLEDADGAVERARTLLADGDHDAALSAMDDAEAYWAVALETLESVHGSAVAGLEERVAVRREIADGVQRRIQAAAGASAHAAGQAAWREGEYERAAAAYERAISAYEAGLALSGRRPTDEQLERRLAGAARERAILRAAPVADAETAARRAEAADDPASAAESWETAFERYRDAVGFEWGTPGRRFYVDRERCRKAAADAAAAAIDTRTESGRQWLAAADKLATGEDVQTARPVYDRARSYFERALHLATEVRPDRESEIRDALTAIDDRLAGNLDPAEDPREAPLPVDSIADALAAVDETEGEETVGDEADGEETDDEASRGDPDGADESEPVPVIGQSVSVADGDTSAGDADDAGGDEVSPRDGDASPRDIEDSPRDVEPAGDEASPGDVEAAIDAAEAAWGPRRDDGVADGESPRVSFDADEMEASDDDAPPAGAGDVEGLAGTTDDVIEATLVEALRSLESDAFRELVAEVWSLRGWTTTVFPASGEAVYDVLGASDATDERLLLWAIHRPDGGAVGRTVVERIATTRDRSQSADRATLVTTGDLQPAAHERATELDVTVVDVEGLCDLLVATDMVDRVRAATS